MPSKEQTKLMLQRVMLSQEGVDFLEYLKELSYDNYKSFKVDSSEFNEIHKGYARAIDSLILSLEMSTQKTKPKVANFG